MRQRLTDRVVNQRAPDSGMLEIHDKLLPAFGIRIGKHKRTYFVMGRLPDPDPENPGKRRQVRRTVGTTTELTLAQAREKARTMRANFDAGMDPAEALKAAKLEAIRARRNTLRAVAADFMEEHGRYLKTADELRRKLNVDILPALGDIAVTDIRRADVKALFMEKGRAAPVAANRLLSLIQAILNYAVDEELLEANPAARIKRKPETAVDRYLSEAEIRSFWNGLEKARLDPEMRHILKLLLVTGQRRAEVALMHWSEIDLEKAVWEIPKDKAKSGRAHRVPLTPLALYLIGDPRGGEYVFANGGGKPISPFSVSQAMRRERKPLGLADDPATPHDLRRTMATHLSDLGIDRLVIGKLLNHSEAGVTGRVYDLGAYAEPKRLAMAAWSNKIMEIVSGKAAPSNVARLKRA